jgi:uncharacterized RDD family membrane protein YckC
MKPSNSRSLSALLLALALFAAWVPWLPAQSPPTPPTAPEVPAITPSPADPIDPDADVVTTVDRVGRDVVVTGTDVHVRPGEIVHDVSVTGGDVIIEGEVTGDLVVIMGKATIHGKVAGDVLNVGRGIRVENGGFIGGDVVALGFGVLREPDGVVQGEVANLGFAALPASVRNQAMLFFEECVVLARPLSFRVAFVWIFWGVMLVLQALIGLLFPEATQSTMRAMRERPGGTALLGILGLPLILLASSILTITLIASLAVPFLIAALCIGLFIGRIAILRIIGARILRLFGLSEAHPAAEFTTGAVLAAGLFLIPFVGLLVWMLFLLWALGGILMALFRRDKVPTAVPVREAPTEGPETIPAFAAAAVQAEESTTRSMGSEHPSAHILGATATVASASIPTSAGAPQGAGSPDLGWTQRDSTTATVDPLLAARPTTGRRLGALLIDWMPIFFLVGILPDRFLFIDIDSMGGFLRVVLGVAYFTTFITWRGTTLGGMVLGLRVVRVDGRPIDRTVALVRAIAAILSGLCLGIGWFWACWDERRQTWHDRLAGTVVVRDDQIQPLV